MSYILVYIFKREQKKKKIGTRIFFFKKLNLSMNNNVRTHTESREKKSKSWDSKHAIFRFPLSQDIPIVYLYTVGWIFLLHPFLFDRVFFSPLLFFSTLLFCKWGETIDEGLVNKNLRSIYLAQKTMHDVRVYYTRMGILYTQKVKDGKRKNARRKNEKKRTV